MSLLDEFFQEAQEQHKPDVFNIGITFYLNTENNRDVDEDHEWDALYTFKELTIDAEPIKLPTQIIKAMENDKIIKDIFNEVMTDMENDILQNETQATKNYIFYKHMPVATIEMEKENGNYYLGDDIINKNIGKVLENEITKRIQ